MKIQNLIRKMINEGKFERIPTERALNKDAVNPNFETKTHKIIRTAYDDEGTNVFVLVDKKNKKIISYSITGNSEREKFNKLNEDYYRLPKKNIGNELYTATKSLKSLYDYLEKGNDLDVDQLDSIISKLQTIRKNAKQFKTGTKPDPDYE